MSKIRIAEISEGPDFSLLMKHLKVFFDEINKPIDFEKVELVADKNEDYHLDTKLKGFDAVHVDFTSSELIMQSWPSSPTLIRQLRCFDYFISDQQQIWPRLFLYDTLRKLIVDRSKEHDIREAAYVVCDNLIGRVLVTLMIHLGHKKVFLVSEDEKFIAEEVEKLRRVNLGVEIVGLSTQHLTIQTTRASILINTLQLEKNSQILNDLAYFNFMKKEGLVLDLNLDQSQNLILDEAQKADLKIIDSAIVAASYNFALIEQLGLHQFCSLANYLQSWKEFVAGTLKAQSIFTP